MDIKKIQIDYSIDELIRAGRLRDRNLLIFGANGFAEYIIRSLEERNHMVAGIIDNNENKRGNEIRGVRILSFNEAQKRYKNNVLIFIISKYYSEMKQQLIQADYIENLHFLQLIHFNGLNEKNFLNSQIFAKEYLKLHFGTQLYEKIIEIYGINTSIYMAPVSSIGDIYLCCMYFGEYLKKIGCTDYVLVIPGKSGVNLAKDFGLKNIVCVSKDEIEALLKVYMTLGREKTHLYVLHTGYLHTRIVCYLIMYKKYTWLDSYWSFLFGLDSVNEYKLPIEKRIMVSEKYKQIVKEKSIILSPYANTLTSLNEKFWHLLVIKLKEYGFHVFTNVVGAEQPIAGTEKIEFGLSEANQVLEYAGTFIGLRSGFCDVIASSKCKKIILYTNEVFESIKVIDFYSLKKMGIGMNVSELEVTYDYMKDIKSIVSKITER